MCEPTVSLSVDGQYLIDICVLHVSLSDYLHGTFHKKVLITTEERKKTRDSRNRDAYEREASEGSEQTLYS